MELSRVTTSRLIFLPATLIALTAGVAGSQERDPSMGARDAASEFEEFTGQERDPSMGARDAASEFTGQVQASAGPGLAAFETPSTDFEARVETLIHSWFSVIEDPTVEAMVLNGLLAEAPFELLLEGEALHDRDALLAWVSNLRATYPRIEYRLDPIRIRAEGGDRYLVRFEFDRHAVDNAGLPHVTRREHTWIVRGGAAVTPVILSIVERPLLFFPGTGSQVVCY